MMKAPKSLRLQIGLFGRTNVGKSSVLNMIAGQQAAITSSVPGTTTDVVEKSMELLPVGPVVFLDTAGIDDHSSLSEKRLAKTRRIFRRADIGILITEPGRFDEFELQILQEAAAQQTPVVILINKIDQCGESRYQITENQQLRHQQAYYQQLEHHQNPHIEHLQSMIQQKAEGHKVLVCSAVDSNNRDLYIHALKEALISLLPKDFLNPLPLIGDIIPEGGHVIFIVPIDMEAPKGRIILPQVQSIRDTLDADSYVTVVKEHQYAQALDNCRRDPDLVVCDSQVVELMVRQTPEHIPCTTFSTLFSRYKGDLAVQREGVLALDSLTKEQKILIAESCSHHAMDDDIGREKLPKWIAEYVGFTPEIDIYSGRDYPENLSEYSLVIHCGACMLSRKEMLIRIERAQQAGVPITNYGIAISHLHGRLQRILSPFYRNDREKNRNKEQNKETKEVFNECISTRMDR